MASNLLTRLVKLEQGQSSTELVFVIVNDGETNEQACQRCFPDGMKPKVIVFVGKHDENI